MSPEHRPLQISYDRVADYAMVYFASEDKFPEDETVVAQPDEWSIRNAHIAVMFSKTGQLLAIEVGGASRVFYPEMLQRSADAV